MINKNKKHYNEIPIDFITNIRYVNFGSGFNCCSQVIVYAENKDYPIYTIRIQGSSQLGICLSGIDTFVSCNNLKAQTQQNSGSNAAGQQGGSRKRWQW